MPAKRRDVVSEQAGSGDDPAPVERLDVIRQWPREILRHMGGGYPWIILNEEQQAAEWQAELLGLIRSFNEQAGEFPRSTSGFATSLGCLSSWASRRTQPGPARPTAQCGCSCWD